MSLSGFFGKKTRALAAAFAIAVGAGSGAYVAHERATPVESQFTLASAEHIRGMDEKVLLNGHMPLFSSMDAASEKARATTIAQLTGDIDAMQRLKGDIGTEAGGALQTAAVNFVNTLRLSENLTERDYSTLLKDYDARVGIDVTAQAGNYRLNIRNVQECNVATAIANMFGMDDEDQTDADRAKDVGSCMLENSGEIDAYVAAQNSAGKAELGGAAGGAALGGFAMLPLLARRRRTPPVQKGFRGK